MTRRPMCLVCLALMFVLWLWQAAGEGEINPLPPGIAEEAADGKSVLVSGRVQRQQQGTDTYSIYLTNTYLKIQSKNYSIHNLRIFLNENEIEDLAAGDQVEVLGELMPVQERRNPGTFDARSYYAARKIHYLMYGEKVWKKESAKGIWPFLEQMYSRLCHVAEQAAQEDAGVFKAMLLGDKGEVKTEISDFYKRAGLLHLLAVSGLHLSFLGLGCVKLLMALGVGCKAAYGAGTACVWFYGILIHGGPSVWRAALMFTVTAGARILGRSYDMLSALAFAAVVLLVTNPAFLCYSGYLLSFGAVLGLGGIGVLEETHTGKRRRGPMKDSVRASLGIQLTTLPLVLYYYSEISLFGIFWNLLILPTAGVVLGFGFLGLLGGLIWLPLGKILLFPGRLFLKAYLSGAKAGAALPFCTWVTGTPKEWKIFLYYLILALLFGLWKDKRLRIFFAVCLGISICLFGMHKKNNLRITCLDVGQGDGIVWEIPGGSSFLVDGGSSSQKNVGRYQLVPYLLSRGIRKLDGIFLTHTDEDHMNGIREILEGQKEGTISLRTEVLYLPDWEVENEAYQEMVSLAGEAGAVCVRLRPGMKIAAGGAVIRVLHPKSWEDGEDLNGGSLVLELSYGKFQGIFTGDVGSDQELDMLGGLSDCDFLKVAHHGSRNSTTEAFLEKTRPEFAFISCEEGNRYGHPAAETLERLEAAGCRYWITKDHGALTLVTDGEEIQITGFLAP